MSFFVGFFSHLIFFILININQIDFCGNIINTMKIITVLIFCLLCLIIGSLHVDTRTSFLQEENGRYVFMHGMNSVYKEFPYHPRTDAFNPEDSLCQEDFENLREWGFRSLRLYVAWQGFQPSEGNYNYTYLSQLKNIVRISSNYNISIILDSHQDLYSRKFCGQGFPDWAVDKLTFPSPLRVDFRYDQHGIPLKQDCMKLPFFQYYITDDVMRFSHDFFTNKKGINDKFIKMWVNVVEFFKEEENVFGYDLLNEPTGGNGRRNPYQFFGPGVSNNKYLLPFYKKLSAAIREVDTEKFILFEPSIFDYIGGFYQVPSQQYKNKTILSYHTYCPFKNSHAEPKSQGECNFIDGLYMQNRWDNIRKLKVGGMMTEFGSVPETESGLQEIERVLGYAEKNWQSWHYWQYKYNADSTCSSNPPQQHSLYYANGTVQWKKVKALSYPYAFKVCGQPLSQTHDSNSYTLSYIAQKCENHPTKLYLNEGLYFPKGFTVEFVPRCPCCKLEWMRKSYYQVILSEEVLHSKVEIKVAGYI